MDNGLFGSRWIRSYCCGPRSSALKTLLLLYLLPCFCRHQDEGEIELGFVGAKSFEYFLQASPKHESAQTLNVLFSSEEATNAKLGDLLPHFSFSLGGTGFSISQPSWYALSPNSKQNQGLGKILLCKNTLAEVASVKFCMCVYIYIYKSQLCTVLIAINSY